MKNLKLWQKAGLITLIGLPLALGLGFTHKKNSQGLEGKLPSIGMSTAQAEEINPQGYEVPDLTGLKHVAKGFSKTEKGLYMEGFFTKDGGRVVRFSYDNGKERKVFGYCIDHDKKAPINYGIFDMDGDGIFESKYGPKEEIDIPEWVK